MSSLTIVSGPAHAGKTAYLLDRLESNMRRGARAILLVPEQSTYRCEQALCARLGGLIGIEVYSFERLCQRLIERYGEHLLTLSDQGRAMVLRRAAYRKRNDLRLFSRAAQGRGFAASMDARIGQFRQSCISPDDLEAAAKQLPEDALLRQKLGDFAVLYRESEAFLSRRYLTSNDLMTVALPLIKDSFVKDCFVYVDDFDRPREQAFRLLLEILRVSKSVTLTLRQTGDPNLFDLFAPDAAIADRLTRACEGGIPLYTVQLQGAATTPALDHLTAQLFSAAPVPFAESTDAVEILAAKDRQTEVALVCDRILELVRGGKRFSDIAVVASELSAYGPLMRRACERRHIPLFYDATRPMTGLAATDFVLSAARCACLGFPMRDVRRLFNSS